MFLDPFVAEFFILRAFSWSFNTPDWVLTASFFFPKSCTNLKLVISPCPADVGRLSAHAQQPSAEVHSCCHWEHTKGTTTGQRGEVGEGGCISVRHTECWSSLWPAGGIHGQGDPRGLLDGVLDLASRIRVLLMSSKSPICLSPSLFPPFSQAAHYSILWMRLERNKYLWQHPPQLGKQGTHMLSIPHGQILSQEGLSWPWVVPLWCTFFFPSQTLW